MRSFTCDRKYQIIRRLKINEWFTFTFNVVVNGLPDCSLFSMSKFPLSDFAPLRYFPLFLDMKKKAKQLNAGLVYIFLHISWKYYGKMPCQRTSAHVHDSTCVVYNCNLATVIFLTHPYLSSYYGYSRKHHWPPMLILEISRAILTGVYIF